MLIYKIFRAPEWAALESAGSTPGAPVDVADGYVHFSTAAQAAETAAKHFAGEEGLVLLALDPDSLAPDLKWEPSRGGQLFPHLYRDLRLTDVLWSRPLPLGPSGHIFPDDMA
ncbi:hypothetical protein ATO6_14495 [Oceanicola sp. 22II-s10i]|uniref:DUF952 domain-containing protein n=1 Tax=Oceanicola sp. 22II-s10i TaxID=1317116 RepID=UPI000B521E5E|nr:DUF952 domain-containing protein [Oceanicola sp. 22II-s10i]OWU84240.1 hypothetical protein ATO6_14495 [Oceanicola sp. 22II-s10i]